MGLFKRIFGICRTRPPADGESWTLAEGKITVDLSRVPELSEPGGAVRLEGRGLEKRVLVFRGEDQAIHALENRCSHAGHRRLDPVVGKGKIRCCSIGQSEFDYEGKLLGGAARESIRPLAVEINGETIVVSVD